MFFSTYKVTLKNLFRSVSFWIALLVLITVAIYQVNSISYNYYDLNLKEMIYDDDPRFVFNYQSYIKQFDGAVSALLQYIVPFFAVITTTLILSRDYDDKFFEIEKSAGSKPLYYLLGRFSALLSINYVLVLILNFAVFHFIILTRGGVEGMAFGEYIADSTVRLLLNNVVRALPCIIFYICLTYFAGTLFKNGIFASIIGMAYLIFCYVYDVILVANQGTFIEYIRPNDPLKLVYYMYYHNTEWFDWMLKTFQTSLFDAMLCVVIIISISICFAVGAYMRLRKRTV